MIRQARPDDADDVVDTFIASIRTFAAFLPELHTDQEHRWFVTEVVPRDHEVWVAEEEERVVGFVAIAELMLGHLYVHPRYQGRGIGSQLLAKTKELRPQGFSLWTFPANESACRFYERHGLCPVEYTDGSRNEEKVPDVRYEWRPSF